MKKLINKIALKIVNGNKELQRKVVVEYANGNEIVTYNINDSEVTLKNVILINSIISGCIMKDITESVFKNSPLNFKS